MAVVEDNLLSPRLTRAHMFPFLRANLPHESVTLLGKTLMQYWKHAGGTVGAEGGEAGLLRKQCQGQWAKRILPCPPSLGPANGGMDY